MARPTACAIAGHRRPRCLHLDCQWRQYRPARRPGRDPVGPNDPQRPARSTVAGRSGRRATGGADGHRCPARRRQGSAAAATNHAKRRPLLVTSRVNALSASSGEPSRKVIPHHTFNAPSPRADIALTDDATFAAQPRRLPRYRAILDDSSLHTPRPRRAGSIARPSQHISHRRETRRRRFPAAVRLAQDPGRLLLDMRTGRL